MANVLTSSDWVHGYDVSDYDGSYGGGSGFEPDYYEGGQQLQQQNFNFTDLSSDSPLEWGGQALGRYQIMPMTFNGFPVYRYSMTKRVDSEVPVSIQTTAILATMKLL